MAKKTCPNGHIYDPNIYGEQCPLCPMAHSSSMGSSGLETKIGGAYPMPPMSMPPAGGGMETQIAGPAPVNNNVPPTKDPVQGPTQLRPNDSRPAHAGTVIRRPGAPAGGGKEGQAISRKVVGILVTYSHDPNGHVYNLYEGRNLIGRDSACNISIPNDDQMSGRHLSVVYRAVNNKFLFRDEQSSNGTFVNKELLDSGELENYDIIRIGSTLFIFIAIPQI